LPRLDPIADIDRSLDHPSANAKGKRGLVFGLDVPGQNHGFAGLSSGSGYRSDGTQLGRFDFDVRLTRHRHDSDGGQDEPNPRRVLFSHCKYLTCACDPVAVRAIRD
jgi:hypothetical protein